jgi:hypothetical protein
MRRREKGACSSYEPEPETPEVGIVHGPSKELFAVLGGEDQGIRADIFVVSGNLGP